MMKCNNEGNILILKVTQITFLQYFFIKILFYSSSCFLDFNFNFYLSKISLK